MLSSKGKWPAISGTSWMRVVVIGVLLLSAAFSRHPMGASMSGALDKVLFDTTDWLFIRRQSDRVAVVLIDNNTLDEFGRKGVAAHISALLPHLDRAASVAFDLTLYPNEYTDWLVSAVAKNGRVVLPILRNAMARKADPSMMALNAVAAGRGQRYLTLGHYGVVTGFLPYLPEALGGYPNIVLEAIRVAGAGHATEHAQNHVRAYALSLASTHTPAVLVMLAGSVRAPRYSFVDVIHGKVPAEAFAGRMVFIGEDVGEDAGFRTSSLNMDVVSRAELDALMTDAMLGGDIASGLPAMIAVPIYLVVALGMALICVWVSGRWMHVAALTWFLLMLVFPVVLLALTHRWLGIGLLPLVCAAIYTYFAWERLHHTQSLLNHELNELRVITSTVGMAATRLPSSAPPESRGDPLWQVRHAMQEIRSLQSTFVSMINQLPYPMFVVVDHVVSVWNVKAAEILVEPGNARDDGVVSLGEVQQLVAKHCYDEAGISAEVVLGGREHMLLHVPYARADSSLDLEMPENGASFLVCLIDIAGIKEGVTHDKLALRHIAHDLRSPLSTILSLIEGCAGDRREDVPDRAILED